MAGQFYLTRIARDTFRFKKYRVCGEEFTIKKSTNGRVDRVEQSGTSEGRLQTLPEYLINVCLEILKEDEPPIGSHRVIEIFMRFCCLRNGASLIDADAVTHMCARVHFILLAHLL